MLARLHSYPPLGHPTLVPYDHHDVTFKVALEASESHDWDLQLWHNAKGEHNWESLDFQPLNDHFYNVSTPGLASAPKQLFEALLKNDHRPRRPVGFTLRFRRRDEQGWKWVRDQSGTNDGTLIYQSFIDKGTSLSLEDCFDRLDTRLEAEEVHSEAINTRLWTITGEAAAASGESSGISDLVLGHPKELVRWFSLVRLWSPWLAPRQGTGAPFAEKDGVLYSFLRKDGLHVVVLAISGVEDVLTVLRSQGDSIVISARNDRETKGVAQVLVAIGNTFAEANAAVMYQARRIVSPYITVSGEDRRVQVGLKAKADDINASWIQDWYDGFTYCTWNGLGQNLTEQKILTALESLEKEGIRITNLIIDDNWQSLDNEGQNQMIRGWTDFEANPKGFPDGLKSAVSRIRGKYPDIQHICVWHALLGYWGGISPDGKIAKEYKTEIVKKRDQVVGGTMTVVSASDAKRMYDDFYSFLLSTGIDSVKTDAQFFLDEIDTAPARRSLTQTYLDVWDSAQLRHFSATAISCMSQTPSIIFPHQLPNHTPALPVRNSDDFFPDVEESHPWHIFCNAHNALMAQHLNVLPDWDMFQTAHHWAGFHASARAISGGPIYVTDEPGRHDLDLISQMTAQTSRGQTVILRPSVVGRSVETYIGFEEERLVKVQAYNGPSKTGTAFLGFWNCRADMISEVIPLTDFMGVEEGQDYVIQSHRTGECARLCHKRDDPAVFGVTVRGHEWELFSLRPVIGPFELAAGERSFTLANLGLVGKMTGGVAIVQQRISVHAADQSGDTYVSPATAADSVPRPRLQMSTTLKALGTLGLWVQELDGVDLEKDTFALVQGKPLPFHCVSRSTKDSKVLLIDVERAWKEMRLDGGINNQVAVEVFLQ